MNNIGRKHSGVLNLIGGLHVFVAMDSRCASFRSSSSLLLHSTGLSINLNTLCSFCSLRSSSYEEGPEKALDVLGGER